MKFCGFCADGLDHRTTSDLCLKHSRIRSLQSDLLSGRGRAATMVAAAIRRGMLPAAATRGCVDCGKPATEYDHRDYNFPLMIDPVCRRCNHLRGPGIWYRWPSFEAFQHRHGKQLGAEAFVIFYTVMPRAKKTLTVIRNNRLRAAA